MTIFSLFVAGLITSVVVRVLSMALAGWLVAAKPEKVEIFYGPLLWKLKPAHLTIEIHLIPLGGSVSFAKLNVLHPLKRVFVAGAGCLALLVVASLTFGFVGALTKVSNGFHQILGGAFAPRSLGPQLFAMLYDFPKDNSLMACIGMIASKMAAANLLPFPPMNGGSIVLTMAEWVHPIPLKIRERLFQIGTVGSLILVGSWFIAFVCWLRSS
jgi:membrane-associated protease RseP (regulator of RpoE activity)